MMVGVDTRWSARLVFGFDWHHPQPNGEHAGSLYAYGSALTVVATAAYTAGWTK